MISVNIISHTKEMEKTVATAAKLCYSKSEISTIEEGLTPEKVHSFINYLSTLGHESPVEHASITFGIEGVSRALTHQLVRHRLASYSQQSQRYVDMSNMGFVVPDLIRDDELSLEMFDAISEAIMDSYVSLRNRAVYCMCKNYLNDHKIVCDIEEQEGFIKWFKDNYKKEYKQIEKIANENARSILPNACETKIVVSMNVRSLLNFFQHRCCERAQPEIRDLAKIMRLECKKIAPSLFKYAGPPCMSGICKENSMQCDKYKGKIPTMSDVKLLIKEHYKK